MFRNNGIRMPVFAGAAQQQQQDYNNNDNDLTELFAEYFSNESEDYHSTQAHVQVHQQAAQASANAPGSSGTFTYSQLVNNPLLAAANVVSVQQAQAQLDAQAHHAHQHLATQENSSVGTNQHQGHGGVVTLPTGRGIKTAWHSGALPTVLPNNIQVAGTLMQQAMQAQQQMEQQQALQNHHQAQTQSQAPSTAAGLNSLSHHMQQAMHNAQQQHKHHAHIDKKLKTDHQNVQQLLQQANANLAQQQQQNQNIGSALSGRLGFSMVGGQLVQNQQASNNNNSNNMNNTLQAMAAAAEKEAQTAASVTNLPVGVGLKIGGLSGIVAQHAAAAQAQQLQNQTTVSDHQSSEQTQQGLVWKPAAGLQGVASVSPGALWSSGTAGGGLSDQVVAERRQRNREHAKRSRVRKKFLLESLQQEVKDLQSENSGLRMLIYECIPQHAQQIITECCKQSPLFDDNKNEDDNNDNKSSNKKASKVELMKSDFSLMEALSSGQQNFVLSDPRLPDNPIVFASGGFYTLTGYTREQVLGRNCRFLQGPATDPKAVDVIRTAVANGTDATVCLLNYKADGTPFWNQFFIAALRDADNNIVNYVSDVYLYVYVYLCVLCMLCQHSNTLFYYN